MYAIDFCKKLDSETSNVTIKGKVTYCLAPKHVVSEPGASKKFDFWSQFFVVKDSTDSIGVNCTFGEEIDKKKNGDIIEIKGTVHKYFAKDKETGKEIEKIVLNSAKVIETQQTQEEELKSQVKEKEITKSNNEESEEKYFRKSAVKIAKDILVAGYGEKKDLLNHADDIFQYINSGKISDTKEVEKIKETPKAKLKLKDKEKETESKKTNKDLEELFKKGQDIGLPTWVELISFAIEKNIFSDKTGIEVARKKLLANEKDCYDNLLDFIDIRENVDELAKEDYEEEEQNENIEKDDNEHYTDSLPF